MKARYFKNDEDYPWDDKSLMYMVEVEVASYDAEMAASLLDVAASYLEDRRSMPCYLAGYIAKAFRKTASATESDSKTKGEAQRDMLGLTLNLTATRRRPKATPKIVGEFMYSLMIKGVNAALSGEIADRHLNILSETAALKQVAKELNIGETTAKNHWYKWQSEDSEKYRFLRVLLEGLKGKNK